MGKDGLMIEDEEEFLVIGISVFVLGYFIKYSNVYYYYVKIGLMDSIVLNESKCVNFNIFKKFVWREIISIYREIINFLVYLVVWGLFFCLYGLLMMLWNL